MTTEPAPAAEDWPWSSNPIPPAVWILVGAAALAAAFGAVAASPGNPSDLPIRMATSAADFLLPAGIIAAADRWPSGRSRLLLGAGLLTIRAILDFGVEVWFAWYARDAGFISDTTQNLLIARAIASEVVFVAGVALLGLGLWAEGPAADIGPGGRRVATIAAAALTVSGALGAIALAWEYRNTAPALIAAFQGLTALGVLVFGFLAIAAIRAVPPRHPPPEILVAIGAALMVATLGWQQWLPVIVPQQDVPFELQGWVFILPGWLALIGLLAVAGGLASGRLFARREPRT